VSYLTESEIDALQLTALPRDTAYMITGVSHTQFSIARHYGGISWNTHYYRYIPETDELVRDDVLRWVTKHRKAQSKSTEPVPVQGELL